MNRVGMQVSTQSIIFTGFLSVGLIYCLQVKLDTVEVETLTQLKALFLQNYTKVNGLHLFVGYGSVYAFLVLSDDENYCSRYVYNLPIADIPNSSPHSHASGWNWCFHHLRLRL